MEIVADLREGVLRGFALEVAQLVHAAALHRGPRPHQLDGAPQPGITVGKVVSPRGGIRADSAGPPVD